jgi:phosphoribosylaminoimidazole carboxylase (NCAIR synthetase)
MARLLARSLGTVGDWQYIMSRAELASEARALSLAVPETAVIASEDALDSWVAGHGFPVVLKTDGSWGGRGVAIAGDASSLPRLWRRVSNPPGILRAFKRSVFDLELDMFFARLRSERPVVNAQTFCAGRSAIVTAASVDGKTVALVCLEVIETFEVRGPAAVVRVIDHPQMAETARQLISRFGLSGFHGFDFIVDECGTAQLLEINPRVTPTCHLLVEGDCTSNRVAALFPFELFRHPDPDSDILDMLDIPVRAPLLIENGTKLAARRHGLVSRTVRHVIHKVNGN